MSWHAQRDGETAGDWYTRVIRDARANRPLIEVARTAYLAECVWLRTSLETEGQPEWLIEMVLAQWGMRPFILDEALLGIEKH